MSPGEMTAMIFGGIALYVVIGVLMAGLSDRLGDKKWHREGLAIPFGAFWPVAVPFVLFICLLTVTWRIGRGKED